MSLRSDLQAQFQALLTGKHEGHHADDAWEELAGLAQDRVLERREAAASALYVSDAGGTPTVDWGGLDGALKRYYLEQTDVVLGAIL